MNFQTLAYDPRHCSPMMGNCCMRLTFPGPEPTPSTSSTHDYPTTSQFRVGYACYLLPQRWGNCNQFRTHSECGLILVSANVAWNLASWRLGSVALIYEYPRSQTYEAVDHLPVRSQDLLTLAQQKPRWTSQRRLMRRCSQRLPTANPKVFPPPMRKAMTWPCWRWRNESCGRQIWSSYR